MSYNKDMHLPKIIRDKMPAVINKDGYLSGIRYLGLKEVIVMLHAKLGEESNELYEASDIAGQTEELADLHEVVRGLAFHYGIDWSDVVEAARVKKNERGGFDKGILLSWVEPKPQETTA